eukprot:TRINITY_DN50675_c0_g1_i1.p1 TRINITY_DN50675_c0_g1~~TRINITY_DN50675_c0_g1_i1.p1  ORF type:complete len:415 (+),score=35.58 TRINITY_DN50675_c0_g1_i1:212-1456(+)
MDAQSRLHTLPPRSLGMNFDGELTRVIPEGVGVSWSHNTEVGRVLPTPAAVTTIPNMRLNPKKESGPDDCCTVVCCEDDSNAANCEVAFFLKLMVLLGYFNGVDGPSCSDALCGARSQSGRGRCDGNGNAPGCMSFRADYNEDFCVEQNLNVRDSWLPSEPEIGNACRRVDSTALQPPRAAADDVLPHRSEWRPRFAADQVPPPFAARHPMAVRRDGEACRFAAFQVSQPAVGSQTPVSMPEGEYRWSNCFESQPALIPWSPQTSDSEEAPERRRSFEPFARAVKLVGFRRAELNDVFVERLSDRRSSVCGRETYWSRSGAFFLFFNELTRTWAIDKKGRFAKVRQKRSGGFVHSPEGFDISGVLLCKGWREWDREAKHWVLYPNAGVEYRGKVRPAVSVAPTRGSMNGAFVSE